MLDEHIENSNCPKNTSKNILISKDKIYYIGLKYFNGISFTVVKKMPEN